METYFGELYNQAESGVVAVGIPAGPYDVIVTDARGNINQNDPSKKTIFLTLQVLNGPSANQVTEVNIYFPREGDKPFARTMFLKKINGFVGFPDVKAAFQAADNAPDAASALALISGALIGKQVAADIGLQTEGDFAGSNELKATKVLEGVPVQAPVQAPVQTDSQSTASAPGLVQTQAPAQQQVQVPF